MRLGIIQDSTILSIYHNTELKFGSIKTILKYTKKTTVMNHNNLKDGDKVEILCHNNQTKENEWLPGIFHHTVTALDRDYRINCSLATGQNIREAAPECVKTINQL